MVRWTLAFCLVAAASGFGVSVQQRRPLLPAQRQPYASVRVVRMQAELAAVPDEPAPVGLKARVAAMMPPKKAFGLDVESQPSCDQAQCTTTG